MEIDGIVVKLLIILFQDETASGKKLLAYLDERHRISQNDRVTSGLNNAVLRLGGSLIPR